MDSHLDPKNRRRLRGLVVDKRTQFKLAVACLTLILVPALIVTISLISNLALQARTLVENGSNSEQVAEAVTSMAFHYVLAVIVLFAICSSLSVLLSLKLSSHMLGPVQRLVVQVQDMIQGKFENPVILRKGDYLKNLGDLLNDLATSLKSR